MMTDLETADKLVVDPLTASTAKPTNRIGWKVARPLVIALIALITLLVNHASAAIKLYPSTTTIAAGQTLQFQYRADSNLQQTGAQVSWTIWPAVGSISNKGLYTAPASVTSPATLKVVVIIVPVSTTQGPQLTYATVTVSPQVSLTVTPQVAALTAGGSVQLSAAVTGSSNTGVTWSVPSGVGTVSAQGVYTAPAALSGGSQTVAVTATSVASPSATASAQITISPAVSVSVTPAMSNLASGQSTQFTASVQNNSNTAVTWSMSPAVGVLSSTGLYTAPGSIASAQSVTVTATSQADTTKMASATVTLNPSTAAVTMPLEVMGNAGTIKTAHVAVAASSVLSNPVTLVMQIHGLEYETQASVQVNGGAWMPITSAATTGLGKAYGAIGGGFNTLNLQMTLAAGVVQAGNNTVAFQFNGTDGNSSGYRVLSFNFQGSDGSQLVASSNFVQDDPSTWTPPSTSQSDISAGKVLWQTASLVQPNATGGSAAIQAHCGDCHTQDGRDLKYFNYSNNSIATRALFHGLNSTQANQIVSYIRWLSTPAPAQARPWNPPYQPGPGTDEKPVSEWAAGAGLSAVVGSDAQVLPYLMPGGSTTGWAANQNVNVRELPTQLEFPDWNHWLPRIHPIDSWGTKFSSDAFNQFYLTLRGELTPNNPTAYANAYGDFVNWEIGADNFLAPLEFNVNWNSNHLRERIYSAALWVVMKQWELTQEFGLEGEPQALYGANAEPRAWAGNRLFRASPNMQQVPAGTDLNNGLVVTQKYLSYIWYHEQLVLNDGNGTEHGQDPIDFPYVFGFVADLSNTSGQPAAAMQLLWLIKSLQEHTEHGVGPDGGSDGWNPNHDVPWSLVNSNWDNIWTATSPANRASVSGTYLNDWYTQASSYTPQQYYTGGFANPNDDPRQLNPQMDFGGIVWWILPRFRFFGTDPQLTYNMADWAATIWPKGNWTLNKNATCVPGGGVQCTSDPQ